MNARSWAAAAALLALALLARRAAAHAVGLSRGEYLATAEGLRVEITLARPEAIGALAVLDADGDGSIAEGELEKARPALGALLTGKIHVARAGSACAGALTEAALTESDGLSSALTYRCPGPRSALSVDVELLQELSFGHRHAAHVVSGSAERDELLSRGRATFDVPALPDVEAGVSRARAPSSAPAFLRMGFEHILAGADHLIFLFGVLLVGQRLRSMALAITAFTVAHSISLALAVLGIASPPSAVVEPAIALSIAYVGVENLWLRSPDRRWRITFPFGLVHGFGFAGALTEVAIPRPQVPLALFSFNAGVEIGQLLVLAAFFPLILALRRFDVAARRVVPALSALVVAAGVAFFVDRVGGAIRGAAPLVLALGAK